MKHSALRTASLLLCLLLCLASMAACRRKQADAGSEGLSTETSSTSTASSDKGADETTASTTPNEGGESTTSELRPVLPPEKLPELNHQIESDAGENLAGYSKSQLTEKWGSPIAELYGDNGHVWQMPNDIDYVIAYFDDGDYVTNMTYFHVVKTVVLAFDHASVTLAPVAGEAEASVAESFTIPRSALGAKAQERLADGLTIYVTYDGTFTADGSPSEITRADVSVPLTQFARY